MVTFDTVRRNNDTIHGWFETVHRNVAIIPFSNDTVHTHRYHNRSCEATQHFILETGFCPTHKVLVTGSYSTRSLTGRSPTELTWSWRPGPTQLLGIQPSTRSKPQRSGPRQSKGSQKQGLPNQLEHPRIRRSYPPVLPNPLVLL